VNQLDINTKQTRKETKTSKEIDMTKQV